MYVIAIQIYDEKLFGDWDGLRWFGTDGHCTTKAADAKRFQTTRTAKKYAKHIEENCDIQCLEIITEDEIPPWC